MYNFLPHPSSFFWFSLVSLLLLIRYAKLIPSLVYAFSIFQYSDCYNFNEVIELSLWFVIRQLLARCFSDRCFDRRLLGISASTSLPLAKSTPERDAIHFVFAQKQTYIPTIKLYGVVYLLKSIKQYINGHEANQIFFRHTWISFDIHTDLLLKVRDLLKAQQNLLAFDLLPCKNVIRYAYECV